MTGPKPDEDVELVPGDPAIPGDQPEPEDDGIDEGPEIADEEV